MRKMAMQVWVMGAQQVMSKVTRLGAVVALVFGIVGGPLASAAWAQAPNRPGRARGLPAQGGENGASPAEIQRLFDAYLVMQAQQELQLTDSQFPRFLARVRALQDVRRRHQVERMRLLQDLRRLSQSAGQSDEGLRSSLGALAGLDARAVTEVRQAIEGVGDVLDFRQQARYRVLEEQMERRKLDLLFRARQANRPRNAPQP